MAATAPIDVTATLTTDTRISLEWKQPKSLNGSLDQYLIKYKKSTDSTFLPVVKAGKNSSANFENLDIFTEYHFQVAATTKFGAIIGDWSSLISVKTKNVWLTVSGNLTIKEGENAIFTCNISENYPVTWMDDLNNTMPSSNGILTMNSVTRHHTGRYYCRATIGISKTILSKMVTLTVHFPPAVRITPNVETLVVTEGNHVQLKCEVLQGNPLPQSAWTDSHGGELKAMDNALTFISVNRRNAKTYTCTAENYLARVVNNITLIVQYRPTVDLLLPKTTCEVKTLKIACHADGVPTVNVKLFFNNSVLNEGTGYVQYEISKMSPNQFGKYSCLASNILGSRTVTKILMQSNCNSSNNQNGFLKKGADSSKFEITTYVFAAVSFILIVAVIALAVKLRRKPQKSGTNVVRNENTFEIPSESFTELQKTTRRAQPYETLSPANMIRPRESNDFYLQPIPDSRIDRNQTYEIVE